jgi:rhodanese-related sulfurtransferase
MAGTIFAGIAVLWLLYQLGQRLMIMIHPNVKNISAGEAYNMINENKELVILDVRTKEEYDRGHIPGAVSIPAHQLSYRIKEMNVQAPILVYCASGGRSPGAVRTLLRNDFTRIYHLYGGIMRWKHNLAS